MTATSICGRRIPELPASASAPTWNGTIALASTSASSADTAGPSHASVPCSITFAVPMAKATCFASAGRRASRRRRREHEQRAPAHGHGQGIQGDRAEPHRPVPDLRGGPRSLRRHRRGARHRVPSPPEAGARGQPRRRPQPASQAGGRAGARRWSFRSEENDDERRFGQLGPQERPSRQGRPAARALRGAGPHPGLRRGGHLRGRREHDGRTTRRTATSPGATASATA